MLRRIHLASLPVIEVEQRAEFRSPPLDMRNKLATELWDFSDADGIYFTRLKSANEPGKECSNAPGEQASQ